MLHRYAESGRAKPGGARHSPAGLGAAIQCHKVFAALPGNVPRGCVLRGTPVNGNPIQCHKVSEIIAGHCEALQGLVRQGPAIQGN